MKNLITRFIDNFRSIDWFERISIGVMVILLTIAIIYSAETFSKNGKLGVLFEILGTTFTLAGAVWTALGVRLSSVEKKELERVVKRPVVELNHFVRLLHTASKFASFGAILISIGGAFLLIKMICFH